MDTATRLNDDEAHDLAVRHLAGVLRVKHAAGHRLGC